MSLYCSHKLSGRSCIYEFLKSQKKFLEEIAPTLVQQRFEALQGHCLLRRQTSPLFIIHCKECHPYAWSEFPPLPTEGAAAPAAKHQAESGTICSVGCNYIPAPHYFLPKHTVPSRLSSHTKCCSPITPRWSDGLGFISSFTDDVGKITWINQVTLNFERALCNPCHNNEIEI